MSPDGAINPTERLRTSEIEVYEFSSDKELYNYDRDENITIRGTWDLIYNDYNELSYFQFEIYNYSPFILLCESPFYDEIGFGISKEWEVPIKDVNYSLIEVGLRFFFINGLMYINTVVDEFDLEIMGDPYWVKQPLDQIIEFGTSCNYVVEAFSTKAIEGYTVNSSDFNINSEGLISNSSFLGIGDYWLEITAEDTTIYHYNCTATIKMIIQDRSPPNWVEIPQDEYFVIINQSPFFYDVNATDLSGIAYYWIEYNSFFTINISGIISNISDLVEGIYDLTIRAYDPFNQYCEAEIGIVIIDNSPVPEDPEDPSENIDNTGNSDSSSDSTPQAGKGSTGIPTLIVLLLIPLGLSISFIAIYKIKRKNEGPVKAKHILKK